MRCRRKPMSFREAHVDSDLVVAPCPALLRRRPGFLPWRIILRITRRPSLISLLRPILFVPPLLFRVLITRLPSLLALLFLMSLLFHFHLVLVTRLPPLPPFLSPGPLLVCMLLLAAFGLRISVSILFRCPFSIILPLLPHIRMVIILLRLLLLLLLLLMTPLFLLLRLRPHSIARAPGPARMPTLPELLLLGICRVRLQDDGGDPGLARSARDLIAVGLRGQGAPQSVPQRSLTADIVNSVFQGQGILGEHVLPLECGSKSRITSAIVVIGITGQQDRTT
mmetsp:Transcript_130963/g.292950  ORF Transcript_130963/g.292950 Transcript_130963/m.292950 type:complete len:281 (+) Transcript_130963:37-879(+)